MRANLKRALLFLFLFFILPVCAHANEAFRGWCEEGNQPIILSGLTSTTLAQVSHPLCLVYVYTHGGGLATIYSDNIGTPLANPFTAQTDGQYIFYAVNGRYDVTMQNAGFSQPITYSDILLCDLAQPSGSCSGGGGGGGGGTLFSFASGNLPPLFTTSVANPTSNPVQSFSLTNASPFTVFGNPTSALGAPSYYSLLQTFVTSANETASLSNSRQLVSGINTTPDISATNRIAINSVEQYQNNGAFVGAEPALNLVPGTNVALAPFTDSAGTRVNVTFNSVQQYQNNGLAIGAEPILNLIAGTNITLTPFTDSGGKVNVTINSSGGGGGVSTPCTTIAAGLKDIIPQTCAGEFTFQGVAGNPDIPNLTLSPASDQQAPNILSTSVLGGTVIPCTGAACGSFKNLADGIIYGASAFGVFQNAYHIFALKNGNSLGDASWGNYSTSVLDYAEDNTGEPFYAHVCQAVETGTSVSPFTVQPCRAEVYNGSNSAIAVMDALSAIATNSNQGGTVNLMAALYAIAGSNRSAQSNVTYNTGIWSEDQHNVGTNNYEYADAGDALTPGDFIDADGNFLNQGVIRVGGKPTRGGSSTPIGIGGPTVWTGGLFTQETMPIPQVVWTAGSGAPIGACGSGSLYTNASGGTGTTLYRCESSAWVAVTSIAGGTVTTSGSPANTYLAGFTGATAISGTANATIDTSGNVIVASLTDTGLTSGRCVQTTTGGLLTIAAAACGTSSGTVTVTGSPASGNLTAFSGATSITNGDLSGDVTTSGTLATTVLKLRGLTLPTLAASTGFLYDSAGTLSLSASASNFTTGTLPCAQLPTFTGDTTTAGGSCATSTVKVNGASVPVSATVLGSNGSSQLVAASLQGNGTKVQLSTGTTTTNHCVEFDANGNTVDFGAGCGGAGTVTSIATTSPLTGGTITTTGTLACPTCVVASSPAAGIAHFAGATQTVTSSPVSLTVDVSGILPAASGGTGLNTTTFTGVAQLASGVWSVSTALANGTTATTQTAGDSSSDVATDAFVASSVAPLNVMTTIGDRIGGGASGAPTRVPEGLTGQVDTALNGGTGGFSSPGVGGRTVSGATDTILGDSGTTLRDRGTTIQYTSGSAIAVTLPQAGSSGLSSNFIYSSFLTGVGPLTITPTTSTINGQSSLVQIQNSWCTPSSPDNANYLARCATYAKTGTGLTSTFNADTSTTFSLAAALPNGETATTQAVGDNTTKVATNQFVTTAVNNAIAGVNPAVAVQAATAAILPNSPTYNNGVSGVGATLTTATLNTALVVDGYTPVLNDRILVKNQASAFQNGVYTVTQVSGVGLAWILTRALDYNQPSDMNNTGAIPVINGTVNGTTSWVLTSKVNTVGTDALTFTQFTVNPAIVTNIPIAAQPNLSLDVFQRSSLGGNWTTYLNGWTPNSGAAHGTTTSGSGFNLVAWNAGTTAVPTQTVKVIINTLNGTTDFIGPAVRISGTPTTSVSFYECTEDTTTMFLVKATGTSNSSGGTTTTLQSAAITGAAGDSLTLQIVGQTLSCFHNNESGGTPKILQYNDASSPLTTGLPGIFQVNNTATIRSFTFANPAAPAGCNLNIIADGDSITFGYAITAAYTDSLFVTNRTVPCVANIGVVGKALGITEPTGGGTNVESGLTTGTSVVDTLFVPGIENIVVAFYGTNDMETGSRTAAQMNTDATSYITARHTAGFKVVLVPVLSNGNSSGAFDTVMQNYDQLIQSGTGADVVAAFPPSLIGTRAYVNSAVFQSGGIHPTDFGATSLIAPAVSAAISSLR